MALSHMPQVAPRMYHWGHIACMPQVLATFDTWHLVCVPQVAPMKYMSAIPTACLKWRSKVPFEACRAC
eukprot:1599776-Pyramimonas_sp.AAC.1